MLDFIKGFSPPKIQACISPVALPFPLLLLTPTSVQARPFRHSTPPPLSCRQVAIIFAWRPLVLEPRPRTLPLPNTLQICSFPHVRDTVLCNNWKEGHAILCLQGPSQLELFFFFLSRSFSGVVAGRERSGGSHLCFKLQILSDPTVAPRRHWLVVLRTGELRPFVDLIISLTSTPDPHCARTTALVRPKWTARTASARKVN